MCRLSTPNVYDMTVIFAWLRRRWTRREFADRVAAPTGVRRVEGARGGRYSQARGSNPIR